MEAHRADPALSRTALASLLLVGSCMGCSQLVDFGGYEAESAGGAARPAIGSFRFERGPATFSVPAANGLLAGSTAPRGVVAGTLRTAAGGGIALDRAGGFVYSPPGDPGAFWGDDYFEYAFDASPGASARARLTVQPDMVRLTQLAANPGAGFGVAGAHAEDGLSTTVISAAGDVNGDGLEDFVLGAMGPQTYSDGVPAPIGPGRAVYVLFGKRDTENESLGDLEGEVPKGFAILGDEDEFSLDAFGFRVAGAGDVNADGFDDVIIGSFAYDPAYSPDDDIRNFLGAAYVVFGKADASPVKSADIREGRGGGFAIRARDDQYRYVGLDVRGAGDVNGDGRDDVIVGAPIIDAALTASAGSANVVFGKAEADPVWLEDVAAGQGGFAILGGAEDPYAGFLVTGVGDVNGDALDDVAALSLFHVGSDGAVGRTVVVFGKRDSNPVRLAELEQEPNTGFSILGAEGVARDAKLSAVGDINGDGLDDVLVAMPLASLGSPPPLPPSKPAAVADAGAPGNSGDAGEDPGAVVEADEAPEHGVVYAVFGKREPGDVSLRALEHDQTLGFAITGVEPFQQVGSTLSAGDVNGDGLGDVVAFATSSEGLGEAYVVFGKKAARSAVSLTEGQFASDVGLRVFPDGPEGAGFAVSGADANGDGIDDLLLSAPLYGAAPQLAGGAYVVFGWDMTGALAGRDGALIGGSGDDSFELGANDVVTVRGGNGTDTLHVGSRSTPLDLTVPGRYESIEIIDVRGAGPQVVVLDDAALRRIPQNHSGFVFGLARRLTILGDAEDSLRFDRTGFTQYGANAGRPVYGRAGAYYGLEASEQLPIVSP